MAKVTITKNGISKQIDVGDQEVTPELIDDIGSDMETKGYFTPSKEQQPEQQPVEKKPALTPFDPNQAEQQPETAQIKPYDASNVDFADSILGHLSVGFSRFGLDRLYNPQGMTNDELDMKSAGIADQLNQARYLALFSDKTGKLDPNIASKVKVNLPKDVDTNNPEIVKYYTDKAYADYIKTNFASLAKGYVTVDPETNQQKPLEQPKDLTVDEIEKHYKEYYQASKGEEPDENTSVVGSVIKGFLPDETDSPIQKTLKASMLPLMALGVAELGVGAFVLDYGIGFGIQYAAQKAGVDPAQYLSEKLGVNATGEDVLNFLEGIGLGYATGKVKPTVQKKAQVLLQRATKNVLETTNSPQVLYIDPAKVKDIFQTGKNISPEETQLVASLGLTPEQYKQAFKEGVSIQVPASKVVTITDKPYWAKIKSLFGLEPTNETRTIESGKTSRPPVGFLPAQGESAIVPTTPGGQNKFIPAKSDTPVPVNLVNDVISGNKTPEEASLQLTQDMNMTLDEAKSAINTAVDAQKQAEKAQIDAENAKTTESTPAIENTQETQNIEEPQQEKFNFLKEMANDKEAKKDFEDNVVDTIDKNSQQIKKLTEEIKNAESENAKQVYQNRIDNLQYENIKLFKDFEGRHSARLEDQFNLKLKDSQKLKKTGKTIKAKKSDDEYTGKSHDEMAQTFIDNYANENREEMIPVTSVGYKGSYRIDRNGRNFTISIPENGKTKSYSLDQGKNPHEEFAKKNLRAYVQRGDSYASIKKGQMGVSGGGEEMSVGGYHEGKSIGADKVRVTLNGKTKILNLKKIYEELKAEKPVETQKEKVKKAVEGKSKSIKEVAKETGILEPNVRRILGVGEKEGTFERVDKGVYTLKTKDGVERAYIIPGDAVETLPKLVANGFKSDMVFLDIPYDTPAVKGGNRGVKYNLLSVQQFDKVLESINKIVRNDKSPIIYMYSQAESGMKKMQQYTDLFAKYGFLPIGKGEFQKTFKDGSPTTNPQGKISKPEGILVFNKTGKGGENLNLNFKLVRPKGYQTEKPAEMIAQMIKMTTNEGDVVLDPFAGSGVVGAEAVKQGRKVVLIENNKEVVKTVTSPRVIKALDELDAKIADETKNGKGFESGRRLAQLEKEKQALVEEDQNIDALKVMDEVFTKKEDERKGTIYRKERDITEEERVAFNDFLKKNNTEENPLMQQNLFETSYVYSEAKAGKRLVLRDKNTGEYNNHSYKSTFPQSLDESLRSKPLLDKASEYFDKLERPAKPGRVQKVYDQMVEDTLRKYKINLENPIEKQKIPTYEELNKMSEEQLAENGYFRNSVGQIEEFPFQTDSSSKIIANKDVLEQIKKIPFLSQLDVIKVNEITTGTGGKAWGRYFNAIIEYVDNPNQNTLPHEAFHAFLDLILPKAEKAKLFELARKKNTFLKSSSNREVEEWLAEDFANYFNSKQEPKGFIQSIWDKVKTFFNQIFKRKKTIKDYYEKVFDVGNVEIKPRNTAELYRRTADLQRNLSVVHNLSEKNLLYAGERGSLIKPSIGIVNTDKGVFDGFGEITLVGDKNIMQKGTTYRADAYSPRYPKTEYPATYKQTKAIIDDLNKNNRFEQVTYVDERNPERTLETNPEFRMRFLESQNIPVKYVAEPGESPKNAMGSFFYKVMTPELEYKFDKFMRDYLAKHGVEAKHFHKLNYYGRPQYLPATPENAKKLMSKSVRGNEGFNYGIGSLRAKITPTVTPRTIGLNKDKIVSSEDFEKARTEMNARYSDLQNEVAKYIGDYSYADDALNSIITDGRNSIDAKIPDSLYEKIQSFKDDLVEMPSEYFETKIKDELPFSDFKYALAPENISDSARKILSDHGIQVISYKEPVERWQILQGLNDIKFRKETQKLSTVLLEDLKNRDFVKKSYIEQRLKSSDLNLKQAEKDLVQEVLAEFGDSIKVADFEKAVIDELLPLKVDRKSDSDNPDYEEMPFPSDSNNTMYNFVALPGEIRGPVYNYEEHIFESPIKTNGSPSHFKKSKNYFGHTRIEDMADNETRRVIEVQSDLYQKGKLEDQVGTGYDFKRLEEIENNIANGLPYSKSDYENLKRAKEEFKNNPSKNPTILYQYTNPTAHFRMVREEIDMAKKDGIKKLQFPTGETAMQIEGLGKSTLWAFPDDLNRKVMPDDLYNGMYIIENRETPGNNAGEAGDKWIVTSVLDNGKFKAIPVKVLDWERRNGMFINQSISNERMILELKDADILDSKTETFDVSGKTDTNNPIYRFYEKDLGKYLTSKHGAKLVTDNNGVSWYELDMQKQPDVPVYAFYREVADNEYMDYLNRFAGLELPKKPEVIDEKNFPTKEGVSRFQNRMQDLLDEQNKGDVNYVKSVKAIEVAKAEKYYEKDPQKFIDMYKKEEIPNSELSDNVAGLTILQKALEEGDAQTVADVLPILSLRATRQGQEISMLRNAFGENDPVSFLEDLLKAREDVARVNYKKFFADEKKVVIKEVVRKRVARVKKSEGITLEKYLETRAEEIDSFLNSIMC